MSLLTYVWHYALARLLYDELVRPLGMGAVALAALALGLAIALKRWHRR